MRSHFRMSSGAAIAAVAGAATMLNGHCSAQFAAADYATNSIYNSGWSDGQNGGYGFGPWSFGSTDPTPAGTYEAITTSSALGTAWTLAVYDPSTGLANAGRSIPAGLQVGQTFQIVIQNPTVWAGTYASGNYTYRGFDILFGNSTTNNPGGDNNAALRLQVFDYFNTSMNWAINDASSESTTLSGITTGASGMIVALTLDTTNTYTLKMAPVSNPGSPYLTQSGTLPTANLPINYFNFRNYNNTSAGPTDTANNFELSSMTIQGTMLNISLSWSTNTPGFVLQSSPSLGANASWTTSPATPIVSNGSNVVTVPASGPQQFYRLKLQQ